MATVTSALGPLSDAAWGADGYVSLRGLVDRATCAAMLDRAGDCSRPHHDPEVAALGAALLADLLRTDVEAASSHLIVTPPGARRNRHGVRRTGAVGTPPCCGWR